MKVAYTFDHNKEIPPNLLFWFQLLLFRKRQIVLGQMLLVSGTVRQEGAWEDPSPLEGWTSLVLAPWVVPWARNFPNFWPV